MYVLAEMQKALEIISAEVCLDVVSVSTCKTSLKKLAYSNLQSRSVKQGEVTYIFFNV